MAKFIILDAIEIGSIGVNVESVVNVLPAYNSDDKSRPPVRIIGQAVLTFNGKPNLLVHGDVKSIVEMIETGAPIPAGGGGLIES